MWKKRVRVWETSNERIFKMRTMVRYGRNERGQPKNTLVTTRKDDMIYFGIARCNTKAGDAIDRRKGRFIANERMHLGLACGGFRNSWRRMELHDSGLRGCCKVEDIASLLQYFDNIDKGLMTLFEVEALNVPPGQTDTQQVDLFGFR